MKDEEKKEDGHKKVNVLIRNWEFFLRLVKRCYNNNKFAIDVVMRMKPKNNYFAIFKTKRYANCLLGVFIIPFVFTFMYSPLAALAPGIPVGDITQEKPGEIPEETPNEPEYFWTDDAPIVSTIEEVNTNLKNTEISFFDSADKFIYSNSENKIYRFEFRAIKNEQYFYHELTGQIILDDNYHEKDLDFSDLYNVQKATLYDKFEIEWSEAITSLGVVYKLDVVAEVKTPTERYILKYKGTGGIESPDFIDFIQSIITLPSAEEPDEPTFGWTDSEPKESSVEELSSYLTDIELNLSRITMVEKFVDDGKTDPYKFHFKAEDNGDTHSDSFNITVVLDPDYHDADFEFMNPKESEFLGFKCLWESGNDNIMSGIIYSRSYRIEITTPHERYLITYEGMAIGAFPDFNTALLNLFSLKTA